MSNLSDLKEDGAMIAPLHAEGRIEHYFSSRVADRVMRKMPCSIMLVKQEETNLCLA